MEDLQIKNRGKKIIRQLLGKFYLYPMMIVLIAFLFVGGEIANGEENDTNKNEVPETMIPKDFSPFEENEKHGFK